MKDVNPFAFYSAQLLNLLERSKTQKAPALWLYQNDLRTPAFMMESLCRLFEKGLGDTAFKHGTKFFKKLEDTLGQIDFYDSFLKVGKGNKKMKPAIRSYILKKKTKALHKLEKLLIKKGGLEGKIKQFDAFVKVQKVEFNAVLIRKIENAIRNEINNIKEFVKRPDGMFTDVEEDVHELRRKLRWLSIYGHSLQGVIKLVEPDKKAGWEKTYLTKNIINLPYNQLPKKDSPTHIVYNRSNFYALSWLIYELGLLKDEGLHQEYLNKVMRKTMDVHSKEVSMNAKLTAPEKKQNTDVLRRAFKICDLFFENHKILDGLILKPSAKNRASKPSAKNKV